MRWPGRSPAARLTDKLYCAPGNAGIAQEAECVALDIADHAAVIAFCQGKRRSTSSWSGPEAPLCAGIVDDLEAAGIKAFGPSKWAARLEGSKGFTKDLCKANKIPTAAYRALQGRRRGQGLRAQERRADRGQGRRARRRQGRGGGGDASQEAEAAIDMMFGGGLGRPRLGDRDRGLPRSARRPRSSRCATARLRSRLPPRRTTSASSTATRGRTPAAWAPIRRRRS